MSQKNLRIFLLEDDPGHALLIQEMIRKEGNESVEVDCASSLKEALQKLGAGSYDVILTDLAVPDSSGLATFERLHEHSPNLPLIILTATCSEDEGAEEALKKGAQDYLSKNSMTGHVLMRAIQYAIERKKLEQLKDDFVHLVSHEIRTPMAVVKGTIDNLLHGVGGALTEKQTQMIGLATRNLNRLEKIVRDILDISRLESGKSPVSFEPIDLPDFIGEALEMTEMEAKEKGIQLLREVGAGLKQVQADREMVLRVLTNLIGNALRYAKTRIEIVAKLSTSPNQVLISIADDGPGIPKDRLGDLFQKFVQINRPVGGSSYRGTGLGLAICKEIVERHHGKIWCESATGAGARFFFTLPLSP